LLSLFKNNTFALKFSLSKKFIMINKISIFIFLHFSLFAFGQTNSCEGIIDKISSDLLIISHLSGERHPNVGQEVKVDKRFQNGIFSGTHSLADGTVLKCSSSEIQIKVTKYTSTLVEDGKTRPMAKVYDHAVIKWEGKSQQLNETVNQEDELKRVQNVIYNAQALVKKRQYKEAAKLLEPETAKYYDCWACHFVLGQVYHELHEEEKAIFQLSIVIKGKPDKFAMSYVWRARAYTDSYPHQYEKAIEDYQLVIDKYANDNETKAYITKEIIELHDKMKNNDKACEKVKELIKLEGDNGDNKDMNNHYCLGIIVPKQKHIRFDGFVSQQSDDLQKFSVKISESPESCYYSEYFDGEPVYQKAKQLTKGGYVEISSCSKSGKMGIAVARINSINGDTAEIEVLYWTNKINGHPWKRTFKKDVPLTFAW
jgi:tetratricopeptide (TPR) repeat protein